MTELDEFADNMFHGFVDGLKVDIFRALPSNGTDPPRALEEITRLLESPGTLPADPEYENRREDALNHLQRRAPNLRDRISELRDQAANT